MEVPHPPFSVNEMRYMLTDGDVKSEKEIPTEIREDAHRLHHESEMDVFAGGSDPQSLDDEFANVGSREPKVCVTTSRDPSSRLKQFAK